MAEQIYKFGLDWETYLHAGLARITGLNGCYSPFSTKRLLEYIEDFSPDVIHIHELHAYFVNSKSLIQYIKRKGIPVIWTFHCEYMYTGKCGSASGCEKWKTECKNCPALQEYPKSLLFDFTSKMFHEKKQMLSDLDFTIVTPSKWLASRVEQSFLKDKEILVIPNGVDASRVFFPRSTEAVHALKQKYGLENKAVILSVAPNIMSDLKGGKTVLEIAKQFPNAPVHFVLIGADADETISDQVTLIKRTESQDELALWYSAADVFLICSRQETFSMTCAEAFCCGTPIAGFKSGGPETVFAEPYALFCEQGDMEGIAKIIQQQMGKKQESQQIARTGYELYDKSAMCNSYLRQYAAKTGGASPSKVLLIDVNCKGSSTGNIVYDLYQSIQASGNEAAVCYGRGKKISEV